MGKEILERNKRKNGPILSSLTEYRRDEANKGNPLFQVYDNDYWSKDENISLEIEDLDIDNAILNDDPNLLKEVDLKNVITYYV